MDRSGAGAYIYAKASGNLGKSFVGEKAKLLFQKKSLSELWTLIFKTAAPSIPEVLLAEKIEQEAFSKFLREYVNYVNQYDNPDPILLDLLCVYEAQNLKLVTEALCNGETKLPDIKDLGKLTECNYEKWPDLKSITKGTKFSWYTVVPDIHKQQIFEFKLDLQIVQHLWNSLEKQKCESKKALQNLLKTEYILRNIVWGLRLRTYFKMDKADVINHLIYVSSKPDESDPIAGTAIRTLDMPLDDYEPWAEWVYSDLINPHIDGEIWNIDPVWIEKKVNAKLNKIALNLFHRYPMSTASLIGWYKIKEYELSCIRTAVESIRLNINPEEAMNAVGIHTEGGING